MDPQMQQNDTSMSLGDFILQLSMHTAFSFLRRTFLAPTFRISVLMTTEGELIRQQRLTKTGFGGIFGCIKRIYIQEGPFAFFRGLWSDALLAIPSGILEDVVSNVMTVVLQDALAPRIDSMSQGAVLTASLAATAVVSQITSVVTDPIQTTMTCYMADVVAPEDDDNATYKFSGPVVTAKAIYSRNGVCGFFRGVALNMAASVAYRGSYYGLLHATFSLMSESTQSRHGMMVAQFFALVSGAIAQPIEVVRRRLMLTAGDDKRYDGVIDCVKTIVAEEGVSALWSGLRVRLLITVVSFAVSAVQAQFSE